MNILFMATDLNFDANPKKIKGILFSGDDVYKIPRYQRAYSWNEDEISVFWEDITSAEKSYFIGSLVFNLQNYKEGNGKIEIIDGQQRILTITIFAAVLRDILKNLGDQDFSHRIQINGIAIEHQITGNQCYRVESGESTKQTY